MRPIKSFALSLAIAIATLLLFCPQFTTVVQAKPSSLLQRPSLSLLAGSSKKKSSSSGSKTKKKDDGYLLLARSIQTRLNTPTDNNDAESAPTKYDVAAISSALRSLSTTQAALKKIDGTAHEMYQRTHKSSTSLDDDDDDDEAEGDEGGSSGKAVAGLKVAGRMSRNAARVGCIADALFAAELCELIIDLAPPSVSEEDDSGEDEVGVEQSDLLYNEEGTLAPWTNRKVVLNTTIHSDSEDGSRNNLAISVLVIYESDYCGGAGIGHGGVDDLLSFAKEEMGEEDDDDDDNANLGSGSSTGSVSRGRYLIILSDHCSASESRDSASQSVATCFSSSDLPSIISVLDTPPVQLRLRARPGKDDDGAASVCGPLYDMAGLLLKAIDPFIVQKTDDAPKESSDEENADNGAEEEQDAGASGESNNPQLLQPAIHFVGYSLAGGVGALAANILDGSLPMQQPKSSGKRQQPGVTTPLSGHARGRTSALCLGAPPCISSNVQSPFVTSIIHGDDIVPRITHKTINHLCDRARRSIKGGLLGRSVGWMSEAVSLTVSGLKSSNDKGSKGGKLVVPGNVFLVRPRRIGVGGSSSIHEVGGRGREAFRAALLWQLNDVLLSKSLWAHHRLDAYIRSLDKVRLKGFDDPSNEKEN